MTGSNTGRSVVYLAVIALGASACASRPSVDGAARSGSAVPPDLPGEVIPRQEPRSRYGNPPVYEVYGVRYHVLPSSYGYRERGVASWYGDKFHGRATSSQEPYDMHAMTAAHKTLPLPTYVEVRNLRNNKSVIVRVNDRGPFVDNRIIDLSYSAARQLDLIRDGTGLVEVTAISFDPQPESDQASRAESLRADSSQSPAMQPAMTPREPREATIFVQVGAFGDPENARRRFSELRDSGLSKAFVVEDTSRSPALYRVRIGPIADVEQYDALVVHLRNMGITESHLVTD
ncbi:MAG TPA: septal ring lytic transglycosylase RlpA family protein [Woeseiaceae bacterium]|nr:septal ring lytic transglycosylase RlpA family protein [Woeseiaceae bacterium]